MTKRIFAFFSDVNDKAWKGIGTDIYLDKRSGALRKANYIGEMVSLCGSPGLLSESGVKRPPNHASYVLAGEIGPDKLQLLQVGTYDPTFRERVFSPALRPASRASVLPAKSVEARRYHDPS